MGAQCREEATRGAIIQFLQNACLGLALSLADNMGLLRVPTSSLIAQSFYLEYVCVIHLFQKS